MSIHPTNDDQFLDSDDEFLYDTEVDDANSDDQYIPDENDNLENEIGNGNGSVNKLKSSISIEELNKLEKEHEEENINKLKDHIINKEQMNFEIINLGENINKLVSSKSRLITDIDEITKKLEIKKNEKKIKEDEKIKISTDYDQQFIGKSKRELLSFDIPSLEKQKNKKITDITNLIGRIENTINSYQSDIDKKQLEIITNDNLLLEFENKKKNLDLKISKIDKKFKKEMIKFKDDFEIMYTNYAQSNGWIIIKIKESINDISHVSDSDEEPSFPEVNINRFKPMDKPVMPSIAKPIMGSIIPIVVESNFGCKPCKEGNICIKKNCIYLHKSGHTPDIGWKNKENLERELRIIYEKEYDEYDKIWKQYYSDLEIYNSQISLNSKEEFPTLGGLK